jgi:putative ABC transport system permease protein
VLLRIAGDPADVLARVREEVRALAPNLPVSRLRLISTDVSQQLATQRAITAGVGAFGALALLLAGLGLYGIVATAAAARTREIGVRIALGARASDVVRMFVRSGLRVTLAGILVGTALALAVGRLVSSAVWGVQSPNLPVLAAATGTLLAAALAASWIPARRAAALDPATTLRAE